MINERARERRWQSTCTLAYTYHNGISTSFFMAALREAIAYFLMPSDIHYVRYSSGHVTLNSGNRDNTKAAILIISTYILITF